MLYTLPLYDSHWVLTNEKSHLFEDLTPKFTRHTADCATAGKGINLEPRHLDTWSTQYGLNATVCANAQKTSTWAPCENTA